MDPLSITVSIIALIGAARKIAESVQAISEAPRLICTVVSETKVLASIFSQLDVKFFQSTVIPDDAMQQFQHLLRRMQALFAELEKELAGVVCIPGRLGLLDRVKWAAREVDVNLILADLLQQKASLNIMIGIWTGQQNNPQNRSIAAILPHIVPSPNPVEPSLPSQELARKRPVPRLSINLSRRRPANRSSTALLQRSLLPLAAVRLARLVRNQTDPCEDFIDAPVPPQASDIVIDRVTNVVETQLSSKSSSLRVLIAGRVSVNAEFREANLAKMKAEDSLCYQLPNSAAWFRKAKADTETCRWMEEARSDIYFVVGFRTLVRTHILEARTRGSCTRQGEDICDSTSTIQAPSGQDSEVVGGGEMENSHIDAHERSIHAADETICAIQYRKVKLGWHSRNVRSATLESGSRWEPVWGHLR